MTKTVLTIKFCIAALALGPWTSALGQAPVISSFSQNGGLICTNLSPGSVATVEWASSLSGPWQTNWTGLDAVMVNSNGIIQVSVPMFYRVRGVIATATNSAPVATDDTATVDEDNSLVSAASVFLANDSDTDGDPLSITAVSGAVNGMVSLSGTNITFTPAANFAGTAGFDYTVSDGTLNDVGHVMVTVQAVNDPPIVVDDFDSTSADTSLIQATSIYLANDMDVDGDSLTITTVGNSVNGTVALVGTTITFTPGAGFTGVASFEYTASDGTATDTGLVTVFVN
jgi:hypothetical protein